VLDTVGRGSVNGNSGVRKSRECVRVATKDGGKSTKRGTGDAKRETNGRGDDAFVEERLNKWGSMRTSTSLSVPFQPRKQQCQKINKPDKISNLGAMGILL